MAATWPPCKPHPNRHVQSRTAHPFTSSYLSEEEVEQFMVRQLQDPAHEAHADFERKTRQVVRLPTDQLVGALNEHVSGWR